MAMAESSFPEQERRVKRLKRSLEGWREVVLPVHAVLVWAEPWHPALVAGLVSLVYLALWLAAPSPLTVLAVAGLAAALADYAAPALIASLWPPASWNKNKEKLFEEICKSVVIGHYWLQAARDSFLQMRDSSSRLFYAILIVSLSVTAWIGATANNLLIAYLITLFASLLPGLLSHETVGAYLSRVINLTCSFLGSKRKKN